MEAVNKAVYCETAPVHLPKIHPDTCLMPDVAQFPTVVFETGYPESWPRFRRVKDLWLLGAAPYVALVFLIKWTKVAARRIKGEVEVHGRDTAGSPTLLQTETIFPAPTGNSNQTMPVTRGDSFGSAVFAGRNPSDSYQLSVDILRIKADRNIRRMGYTPA